VFYVALNDFAMLSVLIAQYLVRNVGSPGSDGMFILIVIVRGFFACVIVAFQVWFFAAAVWSFTGDDRIPRWSSFVLGLVYIFWLALFIQGTYLYLQYGDKDFLREAHMYISHSVTVLLVLIPSLFVIRARGMQPERQRHLATAAGLTLLLLAFLDASGGFFREPWGMLTMMVSCLTLNLLMLFFFGRFVSAFYGPIVGARPSPIDLDRLCEEYHFSARERDIIQLVLIGKSNKEIEQELFISPHTVKNHIYHIFQKAGIKSRGQLVNLIMRNSPDPPTRNDS
jgi:DNA-binding CsgD family transcriptional regulator